VGVAGDSRSPPASHRGGDPPENAALAREVLAGTGRPAVQDLVALNAGAALWVAELAADLPEGLARAQELLAAGAPRDLLERWVSHLTEAG